TWASSASVPWPPTPTSQARARSGSARSSVGTPSTTGVLFSTASSKPSSDPGPEPDSDLGPETDSDPEPDSETDSDTAPTSLDPLTIIAQFTGYNHQRRSHDDRSSSLRHRPRTAAVLPGGGPGRRARGRAAARLPGQLVHVPGAHPAAGRPLSRHRARSSGLRAV